MKKRRHRKLVLAIIKGLGVEKDATRLTLYYPEEI